MDDFILACKHRHMKSFHSTIHWFLYKTLFQQGINGGGGNRQVKLQVGYLVAFSAWAALFSTFWGFPETFSTAYAFWLPFDRWLLLYFLSLWAWSKSTAHPKCIQEKWLPNGLLCILPYVHHQIQCALFSWLSYSFHFIPSTRYPLYHCHSFLSFRHCPILYLWFVFFASAFLKFLVNYPCNSPMILFQCFSLRLVFKRTRETATRIFLPAFVLPLEAVEIPLSEKLWSVRVVLRQETLKGSKGKISQVNPWGPLNGDNLR